MSSDAVKAAVLDEMIAAAEPRVAELRRKADDEDRYLTGLREKRSVLNVPAANNGYHPASVTKARTAKGAKVPIPALVMQVMQEAKGPLTLPDITDRVAALGAKTDSPKGLVAQVSSALYRYKEKFTRVAPATYDLAERQHKKTAGGG